MTACFFSNWKKLVPNTNGFRNRYWLHRSSGLFDTGVPERISLYRARSPRRCSAFDCAARGFLMRCDSSQMIRSGAHFARSSSMRHVDS